MGQNWSRIGEFFELFEKYAPLVTMGGRVTANSEPHADKNGQVS